MVRNIRIAKRCAVGIAFFVLIAAVVFQVMVQMDFEAGELRKIDAEEVASGEAYGALVQAARRCGNVRTPHLYITDRRFYGFNAQFVPNSRYPFKLRRGKIIISASLIKLFQLKNVSLRGVFAHELAHMGKSSLLKNYGVAGGWSIAEEMNADLGAARCVGAEDVLSALRLGREAAAAEESPKATYLGLEDRIRALTLVADELK